jgi:hypothetical protein
MVIGNNVLTARVSKGVDYIFLRDQNISTVVSSLLL